jgi:hypothetical protein
VAVRVAAVQAAQVGGGDTMGELNRPSAIRYAESEPATTNANTMAITRATCSHCGRGASSLGGSVLVSPNPGLLRVSRTSNMVPMTYAS